MFRYKTKIALSLLALLMTASTLVYADCQRKISLTITDAGNASDISVTAEIRSKGRRQRFIVVTGVVKALTGGALLVLLPSYGFSLALTLTAVFVYESIAQLVFAYPSRRVSLLALSNGWLHLAVLLGAGLQILTISLPGLSLLLGLEPFGLPVLLWIVVGVLLSWLGADIFSRVAWAQGHQSSSQRNK
jgi:hypothetical protein